ncbi:YdeI family protein [Nanoarchaeota archaeon]
MEIKKVVIKTRKQWRNWLLKNHKKEKKVGLISYKKHTKIPSISHKEAIKEAICFGWIDTTLNRLDNEKYVRYFVKRGPNANWSKNTLKYAKELVEKGLMASAGLKAYEKGLKKKPQDYDVNYSDPSALLNELNKKKNKKAKENYKYLPKSSKKLFNSWINHAKRQDTIDKRVKIALDKLSEGKRLF